MTDKKLEILSGIVIVLTCPLGHWAVIMTVGPLLALLQLDEFGILSLAVIPMTALAVGAPLLLVLLLGLFWPGSKHQRSSYWWVGAATLSCVVLAGQQLLLSFMVRRLYG